jgi:uncharacterized protein with HEPN domain
MSKRDQIPLLEDMLDSALKIKKYTEILDFEGFVTRNIYLPHIY